VIARRAHDVRLQIDETEMSPPDSRGIPPGETHRSAVSNPEPPAKPSRSDLPLDVRDPLFERIVGTGPGLHRRTHERDRPNRILGDRCKTARHDSRETAELKGPAVAQRGTGLKF